MMGKTTITGRDASESKGRVAVIRCRTGGWAEIFLTQQRLGGLDGQSAL